MPEMPPIPDRTGRSPLSLHLRTVIGCPVHGSPARRGQATPLPELSGNVVPPVRSPSGRRPVSRSSDRPFVRPVGGHRRLASSLARTMIGQPRRGWVWETIGRCPRPLPGTGPELAADDPEYGRRTRGGRAEVGGLVGLMGERPRSIERRKLLSRAAGARQKSANRSLRGKA